jgi:hypothetical protein
MTEKNILRTVQKLTNIAIQSPVGTGRVKARWKKVFSMPLSVRDL